MKFSKNQIKYKIKKKLIFWDKTYSFFKLKQNGINGRKNI